MSAQSACPYGKITDAQDAYPFLDDYLRPLTGVISTHYEGGLVKKGTDRVPPASAFPWGFWSRIDESSEDIVYRLLGRVRMLPASSKLEKVLRKMRADDKTYCASCYNWSFVLRTIAAVHASPEGDVAQILYRFLRDFENLVSSTATDNFVAGVKLIIGERRYGIAWETGYDLKHFLRDYPVRDERSGQLSETRVISYVAALNRLFKRVLNIHTQLNRFHGDLRASNILVKTMPPNWDTVEFFTTQWVTNGKERKGREIEHGGEMRAFSAPEVARRRSRHNSREADTFSLGAIGMMLLLGALPERDASPSDDLCAFECTTSTGRKLPERWRAVRDVFADMTLYGATGRTSLTTACSLLDEIIGGSV